VKWIGTTRRSPRQLRRPLVNLDGRSSGINELVMGLGAAIPSDLARAVAQQLMRVKKVERAWTGMTLPAAAARTRRRR
jgi:S1-C subfamily serine protease